jgi:hypothetical protein
MSIASKNSYRSFSPDIDIGSRGCNENRDVCSLIKTSELGIAVPVSTLALTSEVTQEHTFRYGE